MRRRARLGATPRCHTGRTAGDAQDWDTYDSRHSADTEVYWPGKPDATRGRPDHRQEAIDFFTAFPDNRLDLPYKVRLADGDWTCSVAKWKDGEIVEEKLFLRPGLVHEADRPRLIARGRSRAAPSFERATVGRTEEFDARR